MKRYRASCDEVWFCTELGFPSLEEHRRSAKQMASMAERIRDAGFGAGIQVANTLGHGDVPVWSCDGITWRRMVGHNGLEAQYCACPIDPSLHEYIRQMIKFYVAWQPDSLWIDDDLPRLNHHYPVQYGCFCTECLRAFSNYSGKRWIERESLVQAIGKDPQVRLKWIEFGRHNTAFLAKIIAQTVHSIAPKCRMGLQHAGHIAENLYNGPDHVPIFKAMAKVTKMPVGSRPGAGFYTDHVPREMILKAYDLGLQSALTPDCVSQICAEVENFTHTAMGKTPHGTVVESALDLALGCNSLSYAVL